MQRALRKHWIPALAAVLAFSWLAARACLQSITIDEADGYRFSTTWEGVFYPSSGNHVLNSLLQRLLTPLLGLNEFTVRAPALLGAVIYLVSAVRICVLAANWAVLQFVLMLCLSWNPFIQDYLVAARGYSLAIGFFMAALALLVPLILDRPPVDSSSFRTRTMAASACLGLSFAANFSIAIACGTLMLLFWLFFARGVKRFAAAALCFFPGFAVAGALVGWTVVHYPRGQLYFGATSLAETWDSIVSASFYTLGAIFDGRLRDWLERWPPVLAGFAVFLAIWLLVLNAGSGPRRHLARYLAAVIVVSGAIHWLAFRLLQVLLPMSRTALFFVPLFTVLLATLIANQWEANQRGWLTACGIGVMTVASAYFLGCARLTWFLEWKFDADVKQIYWVLNDLNRRCGMRDFVSEWMYVAGINFYRDVYRNRSIPELIAFQVTYPPGRSAYIQFEPDVPRFLSPPEYTVVYRGGLTKAVVSARTCDAGAPIPTP